MNKFENTVKEIKEIVALGDHYLKELNKELSSCNITIHYNSLRNSDYDNPLNTSPIEQLEALIGSIKKW